MKTRNRERNLLRGALFLIAGATGGYSVMARAEVKDVDLTPRAVRIPAEQQVRSALGVTTRLPTTKRVMTAQEIAPMVSELLASAGAELPAGEWEALQQAFDQRGTIDMERDNFLAGYSINVASSLTYMNGVPDSDVA